MAGNTLDRPLFKRGPQGDMRQALWPGGSALNPKNWRWPWPRPGTQGEFFKFGENVPVTSVDDLGQAKTINTQTVNPKNRFLYGQDIDSSFYANPAWRSEGKKPPPIFETTPQRTEIDLYGNTTTIGGDTKINWGNIYNAPFTNFGSIKKRWGMMKPEQKKAIIKNVMLGTTAYAIAPDWLKGTV